MPRPKQHRKMKSPPLMRGYKPFGIPLRDLEKVILQLDEYEAIRLLDYEGLLQEEAAERMHVSRPTLTRIYESARRIVAQALVEGKMIIIQGGKVKFDKDWYRCRHCHKLFGGVEAHDRCHDCNQFEGTELTSVHHDHENHE
jgi:uncharacterized protein